MVGYTRQSAAQIVTGQIVEAAPINNEFNAVQSAFSSTTGHNHDGTVGGGAKISLTSSITGVLPVVNGGIGGIHKLNATTGPTVNDDTADGYKVGSLWIDTTNDYMYICVDATAGAAIWLTYQEWNAALNSIANLVTAANKMIYTTNSNTYAVTDLTPFARTILDDADAAAMKTTLSLNNVTNTSDANKPVSTAQQTALDLKANIASPTFTGTPAAPTASAGTNTTQLATTAFVQDAISNPPNDIVLKSTSSSDEAKIEFKNNSNVLRGIVEFDPTDGTYGKLKIGATDPIDSTFTGYFWFDGVDAYIGGAKAVTQASSDNSTKVATTAYVNNFVTDNNVWTDTNANAKLAATQGFGAVGSYAWLAHGTTNTAITQGASYSGSLLKYAGFAGSTPSISSTSPSGTWQAVGLAGASVGNNSSTLFRRIS